MTTSDETTWKALAFVTATGAALLTRTGLKKGWFYATGRKPPVNPAAKETTWGEALIWTAASSLVVGLVKLITKHEAGRFKRGEVPVLGL